MDVTSPSSSSGPNTASMALRVRSALDGIRCVKTHSVNPGSACPRYSDTARIDSPPSSSALAKNCRRACVPLSRVTDTPAFTSAGFQICALN
jgi:hypothetical protein